MERSITVIDLFNSGVDEEFLFRDRVIEFSLAVLEHASDFLQSLPHFVPPIHRLDHHHSSDQQRHLFPVVYVSQDLSEVILHGDGHLVRNEPLLATLILATAHRPIGANFPKYDAVFATAVCHFSAASLSHFFSVGFSFLNKY